MLVSLKLCRSIFIPKHIRVLSTIKWIVYRHVSHAGPNALPQVFEEEENAASSKLLTSLRGMCQTGGR